MNEKINLIELLKDCPEGMPLDCEIFNGTVTFSRIVNDEQYPIEIKIDDDYKEYLNKYGGYVDRSFCKCVIFPKGKTSWEGFQRPFVDGDVVYVKAQFDWIIIKKDGKYITKSYVGCDLQNKSMSIDNDYICQDKYIKEIRFATEEEKATLFQVIKDHGYRWNAETKTLEKLIVPKFKVGDKIRHKTANRDCTLEISRVYNDSYGLVSCIWMLSMEYQNEYELVPNKFDPKTLQPFDKVLMTDSLSTPWFLGFFSYIGESEEFRFVVGSSHWRYCIPYNNDTKYLIGKTDEAPEFYRYWEE